jgi:hypothetical protein
MVSPNALARTLSTTLKRNVTAKGVRTMARSIIGRFDKSKHPEYQAHAYSAAEVRTLTDAFKVRGSRSSAQPQRKATKRASVRKAQRKASPTQDVAQ